MHVYQTAEEACVRRRRSAMRKKRFMERLISMMLSASMVFGSITPLSASAVYVDEPAEYVEASDQVYEMPGEDEADASSEAILDDGSEYEDDFEEAVWEDSSGYETEEKAEGSKNEFEEFEDNEQNEENEVLSDSEVLPADEEDNSEATKDFYEFEDRNIYVTATLNRPDAVPDDAEFKVTRVTPNVRGYNYDAYMEALNQETADPAEEPYYTDENTLLYDIAFMVDELDEEGNPTGARVEYHPDNDDVEIAFSFKKAQLSEQMGADSSDSVNVFHLPLEDDVIENFDSTRDATDISADDIAVDYVDTRIEDLGADTGYDETAVFTTDGLSVFAFTVDFHYEGTDYSIPGESQILLSELITQLRIMNGGVLLDVADVESVEFTDEHLVTVEEVSGLISYNNEEGVDVEDKDFLLSSKEAFTSEEKLTIRLMNGEEIEVGVTDAQGDVIVMDNDGYFTYGGLEYGERIDDFDGIVCYGYDANGEYPADITIPASFSIKYADDDYVWEDKPVIRVAEEAFANDTHVVNVTFEGDIELPSNYYGVFDSCNSLKKVTFNGSKVNLGLCTFWNCSSLEEVWAGNATELTIGQEALSYCGNLKKFTAHSEAETTIHQNAFNGSGISAEQITYVVVPETEEYDDGVYTYKLNKENNTAKITGLSDSYSGDYNLNIPNTVTAGEGDAAKIYTVDAIDAYAFSYDEKGWDIQNVTLDSPTGISIGLQAFIRCANMTGDLKGVTAVGENAFWGTKLNSIELNIAKIEDIGNWAFGDQGTEASVTVNAKDLTITHGHLSKLQGVTDLTINADRIAFNWWVLQGDYYGESNLRSITINCESDIDLPFQVFGDHKNAGFKSIVIDAHVGEVSDQAFECLGDGKTAVYVEFKQGVDKINENAFSNFSGGKGSVIRIHNNMADTDFTEGQSFPKDPNLSIVFDDETLSYEQIHDDALTYEEENGSLVVTGRYVEDDYTAPATTFTVPETLTWKDKTYPVIAIKEGAFKGLSDLNVTVEGDVDVRGTYSNDSTCNGAFSNTSNITLTFNGENTTLGSAAFMKGNGVTIVSNGTGTFDIGRKSFFDCKDLDLTVKDGSIPIGTTKGSDGWTGNSFQYATGELTLLGTVTGVNDLYAVQLTKLTTLAKNADKLSGFGGGWADIDVVLEAEPDDTISWNNWSRVKSLTVNYDSKVNTVWPLSSALGNDGSVPVTINYNGGIGTMQGGAFDDLYGAEGTTINIKGNSATVSSGSFPDDANLTVHFIDATWSNVTGAETIDNELDETTVTYKVWDLRQSGEEQKLLSDLVDEMDIKREDGSKVDVTEVESVKFATSHSVTATRVAWDILYNEKGEEAVNVGKKNFLLASGSEFTDKEVLTITMTDGEVIEVGEESTGDVVYDIGDNETLKLSQVLKETKQEGYLDQYGRYTNYGGMYYIWYGIYAWDDDTDDWKIADSAKDLYDPAQYRDVELLNLNKIAYKDSGYLKIYVIGDNGSGYVTFSSGDKWIWLYQSVKPKNPESDGIFIYKLEKGEAVITGVDPTYAGDGDVTVPATVMMEDYDSEEAGAKKEYPVTKIKSMAFNGDTKLKNVTLADSEKPLLIEDAAFFQMANLESVSGDRPVTCQSSVNNVFAGNPELRSLTLHVDGTNVPIGNNNSKLTDIELYIDELTISAGVFRNADSLENLTIHGNSINIGDNAFTQNDKLTILAIDSAKASTIGAYAFKDAAALKSVSFPGGVTKIDANAFENDNALTTVNLGTNGDNNGKDLTIQKDAFKGCTALAQNVTCRQIVESKDGIVTVPGKVDGVPLGLYLVKKDIDAVEAIKAYADSWYKEQGKINPIEVILYMDLSLQTPAGDTVTDVAADILLSNNNTNTISMGPDGSDIDQTSLEVFHLTDAETRTVEHVDSQCAAINGTAVQNLSFHVDSLSPFALTTLGNKYHDDQFWYEVSDANPRTATITGVYDGGEYPVTELDFTGYTHDANAFKVTGIAANALNAVAADGKTEDAINANKAVKSINFTNDGIKNTLKKNNGGYDLPESVFEGCSGLESATFGNGEDDLLKEQLRFTSNAFKAVTGLKTLAVHTDRASVHSLGFNGATGLETIIFTGKGTHAMSNSAFVDAKALKYLRIDSMKGVSTNAFMASAGTAFVTKGDVVNDIGSRIGSFGTYIFAGDNINEYNNVLKYNAPDTLYIEQPNPDKADQFYKQWIQSAGKDLKDVYFNCDREDFGDVADAIDEAAAAKGVTVHYNTNEVDRPFYLDGVKGSDADPADGSYDKPYKTFAKLKKAWDAVDPEADGVPEKDEVIELIVNEAYKALGIDSECGEFRDNIHRVQEAYIKNTVTTTGETWESTDAENPIVLNRDPGFKGVMVQNNSGLSLKNVVLDGGSEAGLTANAPIINSKANLEIHEGAVIRNNKRTTFGYPDGAGGIYASGGVTMDGGEISGNTGMYGGGIQICGSGSEFTMSGGVIKNNTADHVKAYGGGVNVSCGAIMNLSGGEILNNKATGSNNAVGAAGGGIAIGADVSGMCQGARLVMKGGTIDGNESGQSGGGIFIQTNCMATITEGRITNNTAHGGAYGGGGIYANGVRDDTEDGRLYLINVLITDNDAKETGGGYAGCCTSTTYIYMGNGAAIYGNDAGDNSDIHIGTEYHVTSWGMQSGTPYAYVSQYMFNGTEYNWKDSETGEAYTVAQLARISTTTSLTAYPDGTPPKEEDAKVIITGNHSDTKAGGVGSNGFVSIGDKPEPMDVKWTPEADKVLYNRDMKEGETFTFKVYEEKTSQGLNFWWTRYEDVEVGEGSVTGGEKGKPVSIKFDEIDLGNCTADDIGSTRTFLIVEDTPSDTNVIVPKKYYAVTVIIGTKLDENKEKLILTAETLKTEIGNITENGYFEYDDIFYGEDEPSPNATPYNNFGRIREKAEDGKAVFNNYSTSTSVEADKAWLRVTGSETPPEGAKITFTLYADYGDGAGEKAVVDKNGDPCTVTLDGAADFQPGQDIDRLNYEKEPWTAIWTELPAYVTDENGNFIRENEDDEEYKKIVYSIKETTEWPGYAPDYGTVLTDPEDPESEEAKTSAAPDGTITNEQVPVKVSATKKWTDINGEEAAAPEKAEIVFGVFRNSETDPLVTVTVNGTPDAEEAEEDENYKGSYDSYESAAWTAVFEKLPKYDEKGKEIVWTVQELEIPEGYYISGTEEITTEDSGKHFDITNTPQPVRIVAAKEWSENDDQTGLREDVILTLYAKDANGNDVMVTKDEELFKNVTITNPQTIRKGTVPKDAYVVWENLPAYNGTIRIEYVVKEKTIRGYTTLIKNDISRYVDINDPKADFDPANPKKDNLLHFTVTNTREELTHLKVTKEWVDGENKDNLRPTSITVKLLVDGKEPVDEDKVLTKTLTLDESNNWTGTFTHLLTTSATGEPIEYSVKEVGEENHLYKDGENTYKVSVSDPANHSTTVTNTLVKDIPVKKIWDDANDQDGFRPRAITFTLKADGHEVESETVTAADDWKTVFTNLPVYKSDGQKIGYSVEESVAETETDNMKEYTLQTPVKYTEKDGFELTNVHKPNTVNIPVTKLWDDRTNQDGVRPESIKLILYSQTPSEKAAGKEETRKEVTFIPDDDDTPDEWTYEFKDLPERKNGEIISYRVEEVIEAPYTQTASSGDASTGYVFMNKYTPEKTEIPVTKTWDDASDQDGRRPKSITLNLTGTIEGDKTWKYEDTHVLTAPFGEKADKWIYTFEDLDKYHAGKLISYKVEEVLPEAANEYYEAKVTVNKDGSYSFVNTHTPETTELSGEKSWNDKDDQDGIRPESITIHLLADGIETDKQLTVKPDADGKWKYVFTNLDKFKDGKEIGYGIRENKVDKYDTTYLGNNIINTHKPEEMEVSITKTWADANDQDGLRPNARAYAAMVQLKADGKEVTNANETVTDNGDNTYTVSFTNLPKKSAGKDIVYTVVETPVTGYEADNLTVSNGGKITNTHVPGTVSVEITKTWDDAENQDGIRPSAEEYKKYVHLYADGVLQKDAAATVVGKEDGSYAIAYANLPEKKAGVKIAYTVKEDPIPGYTTKPDPAEVEDGDELVNHHTPELTSITIKKVWDDGGNQDGIRPTTAAFLSKIHLMNGETEVKGHTPVTREENDGSLMITWSGLPKYTEGKENTYSVKEDVITGYAVVPANGTVQNEGTLTNKHIPETTEISITKVWDDDDDRDGIRPGAADFADMVELLADNVKVKDAVGIVTDNGDGTYTVTYKDLPKYRKTADGSVEIEYSVKENRIEGYRTVPANQTVKSGETITNTHKPEETEVSITKVWEDADNQDGIRLTAEAFAAKLHLFANGKPVEKAVPVVTDNEDGTYTALYEHLLKNEDGEVITYTVTEDELPGYNTIPANRTVRDGGTLRNIHTPELTEVGVIKFWNDEDDQDGIRPDSIELKLYGKTASETNETLERTGTFEGPEDVSEWTYAFTRLPKYRDGELIVYTVRETAVSGYGKPVVTGDAAKGFRIENPHTPEKISIPVTKKWEDKDDADALRPESIEVVLLADGKETNQKLTLSEKNEWSGEFTELDKCKDGKEIAYTVTEVQVKGYDKPLIEGSQSEGFLITNTHVVITPTPTSTPTPTPTSTPTPIPTNTPTPIPTNTPTPTPTNTPTPTPTSTPTPTPTSTPTPTPTETPTPTPTNTPTPTPTSTPTPTPTETPTPTPTETPTPTPTETPTPTPTETPTPTPTSTPTPTPTNTPTPTPNPEKTNIFGTKTWEDDDNRDGIRPSAIVVHLFMNGSEAAKQTVKPSADGTWSYSFNDLPEEDNGVKINYTVTEDPVDGYTPTINGFDIVNTHEVEKTEISGTKTWLDDDEEDRPESIVLQLYADGDLLDTKTVTKEDDWKYTFTDLPKNKNGREIRYSVVEEPVENYSMSVDGWNIINRYTPGKTSIPVTKTWNDSNNQDGLRPASVTVHLLADGADTGRTLVLSEENAWTGLFDDLEIEDDGEKIIYSVEEEPVAEYTSEVKDEPAGFVITNTHEPSVTTLNGSKTWNDDEDKNKARPASIIIRLHADGDVVDSRTVTEDDDWAWKFTNLPVYKDGKEIDYTITEDPVMDYTAEVRDYDVINTFVPGTASVEVTKDIKDTHDNSVFVKDETFYVALFGDEACTNLVSGPQELHFQDTATTSTTFTGLSINTRYYVAETDADGLPLYVGMTKGDAEIEAVPFTPYYGGEESLAVVTGGNRSETKGRIENHLIRVPHGYYYEGNIEITKVLLGTDKKAKESNDTFYAGVFLDEDYKTLAPVETVVTNPIPIAMNGSSSAKGRSKVIIVGDEPLHLYITEVLEDGTPVEDAEDFMYEFTVENGEIIISRDNLEEASTITNEEIPGPSDTPTSTPTDKPNRTPRRGGSTPPSGHSTVTKSAAKTGDDTNLAFWYLMLLTAALGISMTLFARKKRKEE